MEQRRAARAARQKELAEVDAQLSARRRSSTSSSSSLPPSSISSTPSLPSSSSSSSASVRAVRSPVRGVPLRPPTRSSALDSWTVIAGRPALLRAATSLAVELEGSEDSFSADDGGGAEAEEELARPIARRPAGSTVDRAHPHVAEPARGRWDDGGGPSAWTTERWNRLRDHLVNEGALAVASAARLLAATEAALRAEPNVVRAAAPVAVFGDVHGQLHDLLPLLHSVRAADADGARMVFLGDYVDRGCFSTEVCFLLFALKLLRPRDVVLLRGNHESRLMTQTHNFERECLKKYGPAIYAAFLAVFDALPIAAVVDAAGAGRFLCVHGGLSPDLADLDALARLDRFAEIPDAGLLCDVLWSDPLTDQFDLTPSERRRVSYLRNEGRGCGQLFGEAALAAFLDRCGLTALVRAHEVQPAGYLELFPHPETGAPRCLTVFSAPNYCDMYNNLAAVLHIDASAALSWTTHSWSSHPAVLPDFANAVEYSLPMVAEHLAAFFLRVFQMADEVASESGLVLPAPRESRATVDDARELQRRRLARAVERMRASRRHDALLASSRRLSFGDARAADRANEARPPPQSALPWRRRRATTL